jgi:signal transduction histidine kinase
MTMVLVLAVVALSFAAEVLGQRRHQGLEIERMREHTVGLATLATMQFRSGTANPAALETLLQQELGSSRSTQAVEIFMLRQGRPAEAIATSGIPMTGIDAPSGQAAIDDSRLESDGVVIIEQPVPTFSPSGNQAVLRLTARAATWTGAADWQAILFVAFGVAVLLSLLGALLLELQVLRPLRALEEGVARVKAGDLSVQLEHDGAAELHRVAQGFNEMTEALEAQRNALRDQGVELRRNEHLADVGRLAAGVAHEVGNPLAALLGYVEFLLDPRAEPPLSDEQRGLLERIRKQTVRIQDIVGQLLDYSRERKLEPAALPTGELASEVMSLLRANTELTGLEVEVVGARDAEVWADPKLLTQILLNLGVNAAKAAASGGEEVPRVQIAIRELDRQVAIEVRDNGPGVPDDLRERIFEPFFTTRAAGEGTGLGLAISVGLADVMGATLECAPEASLLGGACFVLTVPRPTPADAELSLVQSVEELT